MEEPSHRPPRSSIITPLYNGEAHILECIRSVQAQTDGDYEHVVIDNNSSDDGPAIVAKAALTDPRIKLLSCATPGAGPARNAGIEAARGRFICFLDCDDSWRPEKLARQIAVMQDHGLALSWTSYAIRGADGAEHRIQRADGRPSYRDILAKRSHIGCLTAAYDSQALGKLLMNDLPMRQDFCLWLDAIRKADDLGLPYGGLPDVLADYRTGGMSSNKLKAARMQWRAYREHVKLGRVASAGLFASYALQAIAVRIAPRRLGMQNPERATDLV